MKTDAFYIVYFRKEVLYEVRWHKEKTENCYSCSCISSYRDGYHNSRSSNDDVGFKNTSEFLNMNERNELNKS